MILPFVRILVEYSKNLTKIDTKLDFYDSDLCKFGTLKELDDVSSFKTQIKKWQSENCPCRLCKTYIPQVGFI